MAGSGRQKLGGRDHHEGEAWRRFSLPPVIRDLVAARNALRSHYRSSGLRFTLDGNLIGDLGEAIAAERFDIELGSRRAAGIDGHAPDGRSVQVKASASGRGASFRDVETRADHLLFFSLDLEALAVIVDYNGPEEIVRRYLPEMWSEQRPVAIGRLQAADKEVCPEDRLPLIVSDNSVQLKQGRLRSLV